MGLFGSSKSKTPATKQTTNDNSQQNSVLINLIQKTRNMTSADIAQWRAAWQIASNIETPRRRKLYEIYDDSLIDNHLYGAIENNRKKKVLGKSFKICSINDKSENSELSELLESEWFKDWMSYSLDSIYYGHSLVQFNNLVTDPKLMFDSVELVPREHVVPEFGVFIQDPNDDPKKGIPYNQPPYTSSVMSIGKPKNLGLLLKTAPQAISKRNVLAFWDKYAEIFGMPIRIGTTNSRDAKNLGKVEDMLANMGAAAWGLFPEGTDIKLVENGKGDILVYDSRIERANKEMSKAILGETMTLDDGSSKSQSETHSEILEGIVESDADFIRDLVNNRLFPFLKQHGFNFDSYRFEWDDAIDFTPEQQIKIDEIILNNFDVDPEYIAKKYNIPVLGPKTGTIPQNTPSNGTQPN